MGLTPAIPVDGNGQPFKNPGISYGVGYALPQFGNQYTDPATGQIIAPTIVALADGQKPTYRAAITGLVAVTGATDLFTLTGVAGHVYRITRVEFSGTIATAAMYLDVLAILRSTANATGTKTNPASVALDSNDAAATGVVAAYTANPGTLGTAIGTIRSDKAILQLTGTPVGPDRLVWTFGERPGAKAAVLRGVQVFAVNLNAIAIANATLLDIAIEWSEDSYS